MLRKFNISIDGKEYYVEMDEIGAVAPVAPVAVAAPVAAAPAPEAAPAPAALSAPAGADAQLAPMPGKILDIKVNVGDAVAENEVVIILEAMKLENEIVAVKAGTVAAVHVQVGNMVNAGDALITIS